MRKIFFYLVIIFMIYVIGYNVNYNNNDDFYIGTSVGNYYINDELRVEDITNCIKNNISVNNRKIQNILIKSNNIYIDLNGLILNKNSFTNITKLLNLLRYYNKDNIIIKLRKEENILDKKINMWILSLKDKYDIIVKR